MSSSPRRTTSRARSSTCGDEVAGHVGARLADVGLRPVQDVGVVGRDRRGGDRGVLDQPRRRGVEHRGVDLVEQPRGLLQQQRRALRGSAPRRAARALPRWAWCTTYTRQYGASCPGERPVSRAPFRAMSSEHVDVLIVGAGVSGIGCAYHLQTEAPSKSYMILEAREATGGTWDLFTYPGIRSDSDLHTFGYAFKPWRDEKSIADGPAILELHPRDRERERHRAAHPDRPPRDRRELVDGRRALDRRRSRWPTAPRRPITCDWLFVAGGYYRYDQGFMPDFPGLGGLPGHDHPPAALARGPRLRRQARRRDRLRRDRDDDRPRDGARRRRARDDAAALADLRRLGARSSDPIANWLRKQAARRREGLRDDAPQEHRPAEARLRASARGTPRLVRRLLTRGVKRQLPEGYRRRHALQPHVRPVGPAPVRRAGRRPLQGHQEGRRLDRHRPHRALHRRRASSSSRAPSSRPTSSSRRPA